MNPNQSKKWITASRVAALIATLALAVMLLLMSRASMLIWFKLAFATAAVLLGSFALGGHNAKCRTIIGWGLAGGTLLGSFGFMTGYYKPGLFGAEGNLAPLTGVFWTGPIGFVGGALLGSATGCIQARHSTFRGARPKVNETKSHNTTKPKGQT